MDGQVFITQGDITYLHADAIAVTSGSAFRKSSENLTQLKKVTGCDPAELRRLAKEGYEGTGPLWVPFPTSSKLGGMVFVPVVGKRTAGDVHTAHWMVTKAVHAAVAGLRKRAEQNANENKESPKRFLIALIGFRMGMGGDKYNRRSSALQQIRAAYEALDDHPDIDIAFVLDERSKYEIFLEARRCYLDESKRERPPFPRKALSDLIDALKSQECIAFVGAGFSRNSGLRGYEDLIQTMADAVGLDGPVGKDPEMYFDVAQMYRDRFGDAEVKQLIAGLYGESANPIPSLAHYLLLSLPIRFVITTNYDQLLEQTMEHLSRRPQQIVEAHQVAQTGFRDGAYVVKMHGDVDKGHLVLSRSDYDGFFHSRPEMASLLEGLLLNQSFLFVGYSLRDPNFRQVYGRISHMLQSARRPAFVFSFEQTLPALRQHFRERQQLHLIEVAEAAEINPEKPDSRDPDASRRLLYLLDRLGEETAESGRLFLASDAQSTTNAADDGEAVPQRLAEVRQSLELTGQHLLNAISGSSGSSSSGGKLTPEEVRTAGRILALLADMGWKPPREPGRTNRENRDGLAEERAGGERRAVTRTLYQAWLQLATAIGGEDAAARREQRQLLTSALRYADSAATAGAIRKRLEQLEEVDKVAEPPAGDLS